MRSGKEVEESYSKKKLVIDDEEVEIEKVNIKSKDDDKSVKKDNKGDVIPPKDDELRVDVKTLPFPQRFMRLSLDK